MIRKTIISALLGLSLVTGAKALTTSITVLPNTYTNLLSVINGGAQVSQIIITATTATNTAVAFYDAPTNTFTNYIAAYTNKISYATNLITVWTNFYGVVQYDTNYSLIDVTNNAVPAYTNYYPNRLTVGALASASAAFSGVNYYFNQGIWLTNISSGNANVTITYRQ